MDVGYENSTMDAGDEVWTLAVELSINKIEDSKITE